MYVNAPTVLSTSIRTCMCLGKGLVLPQKPFCWAFGSQCIYDMYLQLALYLCFCSHWFQELNIPPLDIGTSDRKSYDAMQQQSSASPHLDNDKRAMPPPKRSLKPQGKGYGLQKPTAGSRGMVFKPRNGPGVRLKKTGPVKPMVGLWYSYSMALNLRLRPRMEYYIPLSRLQEWNKSHTVPSMFITGLSWHNNYSMRILVFYAIYMATHPRASPSCLCLYIA